jgi:hypothetical protein
MQVYLPDELYKLVKKEGLPASELLQDAVRTEVRRRRLLAETATYLEELEAEVGPPSPRDRAKSKAVVASIRNRARKKAS